MLNDAESSGQARSKVGGMLSSISYYAGASSYAGDQSCPGWGKAANRPSSFAEIFRSRRKKVVRRVDVVRFDPLHRFAVVVSDISWRRVASNNGCQRLDGNFVDLLSVAEGRTKPVEKFRQKQIVGHRQRMLTLAAQSISHVEDRRDASLLGDRWQRNLKLQQECFWHTTLTSASGHSTLANVANAILPQKMN